MTSLEAADLPKEGDKQLAFTLRVRGVLGRSACRIVWVGLLWLLVAALLSACTDEPAATPTALPPETPVPLPATSTPTPTPVPPTSTPAADPDPDPSANAGAGWRSRDT